MTDEPIRNEQNDSNDGRTSDWQPAGRRGRPDRNHDDRRGGYRDDRGGRRWEDRDDRRGGFRDDRGGRRWEDRDDRRGGFRGDRGGRRWEDRDDRRGGFRGDRGGRRWEDRDDRRGGFREDRGGRRWEDRDDRRGGFRDDRGGRRWEDRDDRRGGFRDDKRGGRRWDDREDRRGRDRAQREDDFSRRNSVEIPESVSAKDLDAEARGHLRSLNKDNADRVARHLVYAGSMMDENPELAYEHAQAAYRRAPRIDVVREALGMTAYLTGRYNEALRELRTYRRMTDDYSHVAIEADSERGLGRADKALRFIDEIPLKKLDAESKIELALVKSGARADTGDSAGGLEVIERINVENLDKLLRARIELIRADRYEELGREEEAAELRSTWEPIFEQNGEVEYFEEEVEAENVADIAEAAVDAEADEAEAYGDAKDHDAFDEAEVSDEAEESSEEIYFEESDEELHDAENSEWEDLDDISDLDWPERAEVEAEAEAQAEAEGEHEDAVSDGEAPAGEATDHHDSDGFDDVAAEEQPEAEFDD